ncbi:MAG: DUF1998 domain-containing protein [Candidatus Hydrogenedentales bacterium]|jgi:hypothetical protein
MKKPASKKPQGQIRQSQTVTTFGPGALLDLPNHSVIVGGLDDWSGIKEEIREGRLVEKVSTLLEIPGLKLYAPPPDNEDPTGPQTGIRAWQFPEWFITQDMIDVGMPGGIRSRLLVHRKALTKGKFIDADRNKRVVVPIRFVRACRKGHIGDIDWFAFVHKGKKCQRQLWIDERGTTGDISEIWIRCECGDERSVGDAAFLENKALGSCDGFRPWLGPYSREQCGEPNRLLVRSASNAYFSQKLSVISLPDRSEMLAQAVAQAWTLYLQKVDSLDNLKLMLNLLPPLKEMLSDYTPEEIFTEIQARNGATTSAAGKSVKQAEIEVLISSQEEIGNDIPDGDFYARALPRSLWDSPSTHSFERVVLVHRLREVTAQVGFTRLESSSPDVEGELDAGVTRAVLARETKWLPAIENRGEGVFIQIKTDAIRDWLSRPAVKARGRLLMEGFQCWIDDHEGSSRKFFGLPYIMLHSLSHLLITAVSLECGYPASSIRERIYSLESGYGILLYTGTSDAEGTLGGLVEVGRRIDQHLHNALELGRLCSNDPVCAQHGPANTHERRFLHGAACHGCLLTAETSCEQYNDFLDRALVVPTVENLGAEFFTTP